MLSVFNLTCDTPIRQGFNLLATMKAGRYIVEMPGDYNPLSITAEDLYFDDQIVVLNEDDLTPKQVEEAESVLRDAQEAHNEFVASQPLPLRVQAATRLEDLLELLNAAEGDLARDHDLDVSDLPIFGGEEPATGADRVWSWDEDRVLVSTNAFPAFEIMTREDWAD